MKQLKKNTIVVIVSIILSYFINAYWYNTFDSSKYPLEAKITTAAFLFASIMVYFAVIRLNEGELIEQKRKLQNQLTLQKEDCKHDWQKAEHGYKVQECIKCKSRRGVE